MRKRMKAFFIVLCVLALARFLPPTARAAENNRFNVSFVVDASASMQWTDNEKLRFGAIRLFLRLLTERGNVVGCVVFSDDVISEIPPMPINSQSDKDLIAARIESIPDDGQWTNTGEALMTAVESLIRYGNPDNPSVILLLSDGCTEMSTTEETEASIKQEDEAIRRAEEHGIQIYSLCLNTDGSANTDEMLKISTRPERFQNVAKADDLRDAFNRFYDMIYRTSTVSLFDGSIPSDGWLETSFECPGIGVEEINIVIFGNLWDLQVTRPDDTICNTEPLSRDYVTTLKLTDLMPGRWHLRAKGLSDDQVKVNMKYNTDIVVNLHIPEPESETGVHQADQDETVQVILSSSGGTLGTSKDYEGYQADLLVLDEAGKELAVYPMNQANDSFQTVIHLSPGSYYFRVHISGHHIEEDSEQIGPLTYESPPPPPPENHPPVPAVKDLTETFYLLPRHGAYTLNLDGLASDPDGDSLEYSVEESAFGEDDYSLSGNSVLLYRFPSGHGYFLLRAKDPGGLSCTVRVDIRAYPAPTVLLSLLLALALLLLLGRGLVLLYTGNLKFMGTVSAFNMQSGEGVPVTKNKGRISLSALNVGSSGLSGRCYFQASGREYVWFVSPWPARRFYTPLSRHPERRVRLESGFEQKIAPDVKLENGIRAQFDSVIQGDEVFLDF